MGKSVNLHVLFFVMLLVVGAVYGCSTAASETVVPTQNADQVDVENLLTSPTSHTFTASVPPTAAAPEVIEDEVKTGVGELDRIIRIVLDGDAGGLRSNVQYTQARCTFADGLGGPPKCREGEVEGELLEVLPFLGPEGHFIRKKDIESWIGIGASDLYAVYTVSDSAFTDPIYPRGKYAIAFINEARFMITTFQIVEGHIVRVDSDLGNPPKIRRDDVDKYLIPPMESDQ